MCSNPTQLCRNIRSSKVTAGENPSYRLGILFCTRPVDEFVHIALCTNLCPRDSRVGTTLSPYCPTETVEQEIEPVSEECLDSRGRVLDSRTLRSEWTVSWSTERRNLSRYRHGRCHHRTPSCWMTWWSKRHLAFRCGWRHRNELSGSWCCWTRGTQFIWPFYWYRQRTGGNGGKWIFGRPRLIKKKFCSWEICSSRAWFVQGRLDQLPKMSLWRVRWL